MQRAGLILSLTVVFALGTAGVHAQKGQAGAKAKAPAPAAKLQAPKAPPSQAGAKAPRAQTPKTQASPARGPKSTPSASTTGTSTKGKGQAAQSQNPRKTEAVATTAAAPDPATTTVTLTPVQQKLQRNTNLADKLSTRLPPGTDLMKASDGFRNLGQFVAAVNVSNNLNLPFADVKTRVVDGNMSLGQTIKELRPFANSNVEVRRAEDAATLMIGETEPSQKKNPPQAKGKKRG